MEKKKSIKCQQDSVLAGVLVFLLFISAVLAGCLAIEVCEAQKQANIAEERLEQLKRDAVYLGVGEWSINSRGHIEFELKRHR